MKTALAFELLLVFCLIEPFSVESRQSQPESQEPTARFGVEVDYVEVNAVVTDADGNFISDLGLEDFEIYEDGKLQEIAGFTVINIPVERPRLVPFVDEVEPDVRTNRQVSEGRIYVIVLDANHTEARRSESVRRGAGELIQQWMGTNDMAAVVHTGGRAEASQEFTSSKRLLLAAIDRFVGRKLRSATLEKQDQRAAQLAGPNKSPPPPYDPWELERVERAQSILGMLKEVSEGLADIHGRRKAVVYFGEGIDYNIYDVFENNEATSIIDSTQRTLGEATRANVAIYTIDPRGLVLASEGLAAVPGGASNISALQAELAIGQDSLRVLAAETGGFAILNQNDFKPGLARIVEENSHYYLLGYYPSRSERDGKYRKIEVRVDRPGVEVRARKGYLAPGKGDKRELAEVDVPEGSSPELNRLVQSPLPVPGIEMRVTASVFRIVEDRSVVPLVVEMNIDRFRFEERDGQLHDKVEFSAIAIDYQGEVEAGVRRDFQLSVLPRGYRLMAQAGFRVMTALELPSGKYQIRIVASEAGAGQGGSLFYDVEIPEYGKSDFVMTPLVVTSSVESSVPIYGTEEDKQKAILLPTTRRTFSRQDRLTVLAGIYPPVPSGSGPPKLEVTTTIKATDGQAVFKHTEARGGEKLTEPGEGIIHKVEIPLTDLPPGDYLLEMKARDTSKEIDVIQKVVIEIF